MKGNFNFHFTKEQEENLRLFPEQRLQLESILRDCPVITEPENPKTPFDVSIEPGVIYISNPEVNNSYKIDMSKLSKFKEHIISEPNKICALSIEYPVIFNKEEKRRYFAFLKTM